MSSDWYEVLALGMRYWFVALAVLLVWQAASWQREDNKRRAKVLSNLPDAGYIGTLYVMHGESDVLDEGDNLNIPAEGVLGSAMGCDVYLPHQSVDSRHVVFHLFRDGLHVRAHRDQKLVIDGQALPPGEQAILRHGAVMTVGSVVLQLRLFVGVDVKGSGSSMTEMSQAPDPSANRRRIRALPGGEQAAEAPAPTRRGRKAKKPAARRNRKAAPQAQPSQDPWETGQWEVYPEWQDEDNPYYEDDAGYGDYDQGNP